jgi:hypothetical protein
MATRGNLSRSDLVWKEGLQEWQAAANVKGLFSDPPPTPGGSPDEGDDFRFADDPPALCPKKPAREETHPEVERFLRSVEAIKIPREYRYQTTATSVSGTAEGTGGAVMLAAKLMAASLLVGIIGGATDAAFLLVPLAGLLLTVGFVLMLVGYLLPSRDSDSLVEFSIDFSGPRPRWQSNDEKFWKNMRQFFRL